MSNNYGMVYNRQDSRSSNYRPKIGNKRIEVAGAAGSQKLAATLQANQLMISGLFEDKVTVLTEVTESRDGEKEESMSAPSTHRSQS